MIAVFFYMHDLFLKNLNVDVSFHQQTSTHHTMSWKEGLIMSHVSSAAGIYTNTELCTLTRGRSHQMPSCVQTQMESHKTQEFGNTFVWHGFVRGTACYCSLPSTAGLKSHFYIHTGLFPHKNHHVTSEDFEYSSTVRS